MGRALGRKYSRRGRKRAAERVSQKGLRPGVKSRGGGGIYHPEEDKRQVRERDPTGVVLQEGAHGETPLEAFQRAYSKDLPGANFLTM